REIDARNIGIAQLEIEGRIPVQWCAISGNIGSNIYDKTNELGGIPLIKKTHIQQGKFKPYDRGNASTNAADSEFLLANKVQTHFVTNLINSKSKGRLTIYT